MELRLLTFCFFSHSGTPCLKMKSPLASIDIYSEKVHKLNDIVK